MPHLLHMSVGCGTAVVFFFVTALLVVASCDLNPVAKGFLSSPAAYARLKILLFKAIFVVVAACLMSIPKVQAVAEFIAVTFILYYNLESVRAAAWQGGRDCFHIVVVWDGLKS